MNQNPLWTLFSLFSVLSLLAVGGANAAIPEMHRVAVDVMHWMSNKQFADMFAISQLSPGPNVIIVALIGFHVAGLSGAAVAITAMVVPTCVLAYFVARTWDRFKDARWRIAVQAGLVQVSLGLIGASAFVLFHAAGPYDLCRADDRGDRRDRVLDAHRSALGVCGRRRARLRRAGLGHGRQAPAFASAVARADRRYQRLVGTVAGQRLAGLEFHGVPIRERDVAADIVSTRFQHIFGVDGKARRQPSRARHWKPSIK